MGLISSLKGAVRMTGNFCKKNSPELLLAAGVITFVSTVVVACKETKRTDDILESFHDQKNDLNKDHAIMEEEDFTEQEYKHELTKLYFQTGGKIALNYAPAAGLGALSLGCFLGSYGILKKRNLALLAAYNAVNEAFQAYRARVLEKEGQDADFYYMTGQQMKTITVKDENGNKVKEKIAVGTADGKTLYAFKFSKYKENGQRNRQWSDVDPLFNEMYLRGMQNELNDTLYLRTIFDDRDHHVIQPGHVFLNEIRDLLGEDHCMVGSIVGNLYSDRVAEGCDGYINFNTAAFEEPDPDNPSTKITSYWIYPNVDGVIYDLLDQWKEKGLPERTVEQSYLIDRDLPEATMF